jgi:hypothetical protein
MTTIIGLDPTSGPIPATSDKTRAERRAVTLDGAVIGLVINGLGESEKFLHAVYDEVRTMANVTGAVAVVKPSVSVAPEPMDWERLISQVTVAVAGFGG